MHISFTICCLWPYTVLASVVNSRKSPTWTMSAEEIKQEAQDIIESANKFLDKIAAIRHPTVQNTLMPLIHYENENAGRETMIVFYKSVSPWQDVRDASSEAEKLLEQSAIEIGHRQDLYEVYSRLWEEIKNTPGVTDPESFRWLEKVMTEYKRNGMGLPPHIQNEIKMLQVMVSNFLTTFERNCLEENGHLLFTPEELEGVSDHDLRQFPTVYEDGELKHRVSLKYTDIFVIMQHCSNQTTREIAHLEYMNKVPENDQLLWRIVSARFRIAKLLGYKSYSHFVLEENMAQTPNVVISFLKDLKKKLLPIATREAQKLLRLKSRDLRARNLPTQSQVYAWDVPYYTARMLEKEFRVDEQRILEYFPLEQTVQRIFEFYEKFFDLKIMREEKPDPATLWHSEVMKYAVYQNVKQGDPKMRFMGWLYLDLTTRDGKFTHAATFRLKAAYVRGDGSRSPSCTAIVCSFSRTSPGVPTLLRHKEVETLFHELGHGFHHILSETQHVRFQGAQVPRDFVECPSQMLEYWAWAPQELRRILGHYDSGKALPAKMVDRLVKLKYVNSALATLHQITYCIFDMSLHMIDDDAILWDLDLAGLWNGLLNRDGLISDGGTTNIGYTTFGHLVMGYESGYYGYLYLKVFAADMFHSQFEADPTDGYKGVRYRDVVLKRGGSRDILGILEEFLGRAPSSDAFLREVFG